MRNNDEPIVGLLVTVMLREHDEFVVETRENRSNGGLADFATLRISTNSDDVHDFVEGREFLDLDDRKEIDS